jgi:peptidoglycan hydrolase-like protein with peptidoglycan-binding domain
MAATVKLGSKGSDVSSLQSLLNANGANLSVDGIFGEKTLAALRDYQSRSGISVDGIAGAQTWGALNGASAAGTSATQTSGTAGDYTGAYDTSPIYASGSGTSVQTSTAGGAAYASALDPWFGTVFEGAGGSAYTPAATGASAVYTPTAGADGTDGAGGSGGDGTGSGSSSTEQYREYPFGEMMDQLDMGRYEAKSDEELEKEARALYDPVYNAEKMGLEQERERTALMLDQQLSGMGTSYDRQREDTQTAYDQAVSDAGLSMLSRGMQRSSYGAQVQGNIAAQGARARDDINTAQTTAENNLRAQGALYDQQYQQSLTRLATDYETNVMNQRNQLAAREYDRAFASQQAINNLNLALYEASRMEAQMAEQIRQWNADYEEGKRQFNLGLQEQQAQYAAQLAESQRQFGLSYGLQQQQLAAELEMQRQQQAMQQAQFAESQRQFNANLAFQQSQFAWEQQQAAAKSSGSGTAAKAATAVKANNDSALLNLLATPTATASAASKTGTPIGGTLSGGKYSNLAMLN